MSPWQCPHVVSIASDPCNPLARPKQFPACAPVELGAFCAIPHSASAAAQPDGRDRRCAGCSHQLAAAAACSRQPAAAVGDRAWPHRAPPAGPGRPLGGAAGQPGVARGSGRGLAAGGAGCRPHRHAAALVWRLCAGACERAVPCRAAWLRPDGSLLGAAQRRARPGTARPDAVSRAGRAAVHEPSRPPVAGRAAALRAAAARAPAVPAAARRPAAAAAGSRLPARPDGAGAQPVPLRPRLRDRRQRRDRAHRAAPPAGAPLPALRSRCMALPVEGVQHAACRLVRQLHVAPMLPHARKRRRWRCRSCSRRSAMRCRR